MTDARIRVDAALPADLPPTGRRAFELVPTTQLRTATRPLDRPDPSTSRPVWSAFRYSLRGTDGSAERPAIWRELRGLRALNLLPTVWAVAHESDTGPRLERLVERVRCAGGDAAVTTVGRLERSDMELQSRLNRSCERLWDDLFNATDWFESQVSSCLFSSSEQAAGFDELRSMYASLVSRDFVRSSAAVHAANRLRHLAELPRPDDDDATPSGRRRIRHRVSIDANWLLPDGTSMLVARLEPCPSPSWEQALRAFESLVYRPSPGRMPIEHGVSIGQVPPGGLDDAVASLTARTWTFEQSLA